MGVKDRNVTVDDEVRDKNSDLELKADQSDSELLNSNNLISLSSAYSPEMRLLAASNLKYYPEHIDILIDYFTNETSQQVLKQAEASLLYLSQSASLKEQIIEQLDESVKELEFKTEYACQKAVSLLNVLKTEHNN